MTIESEDIIREMLENNGIYPANPQAAKIYKYLSRDGRTLYAVFVEEYEDDMMESPYVKNPVLLWSRQSGLTERGREVVREMIDKNQIKEKNNE